MSKKRVLLISYQFPPFAGTGVFRVLNFVEHLPAQGWDPVVLSVQPDHYEKGTSIDNGLCARVNDLRCVYKTKCFQVFEFVIGLRGQFWHSVSVARASQVGTGMLTKPTRKGFWKRIKDLVTLAHRIPDKHVGWIPYGITAGFHICRHEKPDVIYASGGPWTSFLIGLALKSHFHLPLVIDFRDPWVDNPYDELNVGLRRRVNRFLERRCLRKADVIIANTDPLRTVLAGKVACKHKCHTITNGYNENEYIGLSPQKNDCDSTVVTHVGSLYGKRTPDSFLMALVRLIDKGCLAPHEVTVRFVGHVDEARIHNVIGIHPLRSSIICSGVLPKGEALKALFQSDIALLIQPDTQLQVPAKLFEYIRSQKPILAVCGEGATQDLIEAHGLGVVANTDDPQGMERAILAVIQQTRSRERIVKKDYQQFEAGALTAQLAGVLDSLYQSSQQTKNG
ncbi:glycosyltransferase [Desulfoluna spongiiphila]|uniref:glycosyltransferase n=1 Tax=Desulfoluna spongiiphila TaxID=419481 RepID=UPI001253D7CA|nr:glycosyltransferase [Desulfoluna spongiiphila]VVS94005.1 glycosyltransferase subfamily 4-like n-terminal domain [Desulfoluna spongiiphila]